MGTICDLVKNSIAIEIDQRLDTDRELSQPIEMLVALPKGDRQRVLIEGLVPFGCQRLVPIICERSVVIPKPNAIDRLRRYAIEASKQCGRNRLMEIAEPATIQDVCDRPPVIDQLRLVAHPSAQASGLLELITMLGNPARPLSDSAGSLPVQSASVLIGPEGGLTETECAQLLDRGWQAIQLGPRILRIEMAALFIAAWWASRQ